MLEAEGCSYRIQQDLLQKRLIILIRNLTFGILSFLSEYLLVFFFIVRGSMKMKPATLASRFFHKDRVIIIVRIMKIF